MRRLALLVLAACERAPAATPPPQPAPAIAVRPDVLDLQFADRLRERIAYYGMWGTVDDVVRPAPIPCSAGAMMGDSARSASVMRMSAAGEGPHVAKLFYLYPSDRAIYVGDDDVPVGFAIVKESYVPVKLTAEEAEPPSMGRVQRFERPASVLVDGVHYAMGERAGLFAMMKVGDETTKDTDHGWIYAILDTQQRIEAIGNIERCATCHADATHERMFGVEPQEKPQGLGFGGIRR